MPSSMKPNRAMLTDIAMDFNIAAMRKQSDSAFKQRLLQVILPSDVRKIGRLTEQIQETRERLGDTAKNSRFYTSRVFDLADTMTKIYMQFCDAAELKDCVPQAAQNTCVIDAFENSGVSDFAGLCRATL